MLETPKSAKTPSTPGIPNSCTTSAILENDDRTSVTVVPNLLSRSAASCSACASWSRLINFPDLNRSAIAAECPPAPSVASMYVPSGFTSSHSSTSSSKTGVCGTAPLTTTAPPLIRAHFDRRAKQLFCASPHLDLRLTWPDLYAQRCPILVRKWLIFQVIQDA